MEAEYKSLTVVRLRELLRERGLRVSGRKAELVARLMSSEEPSSPGEPSTPSQAPGTPPQTSPYTPAHFGRSSARKLAGKSPRVEPESPYRAPRRVSRLSSPIQERVDEQEVEEDRYDTDVVDELALADELSPTEEAMSKEDELEAVLQAIQTHLDSQRAVEQIQEEARLEVREDWKALGGEQYGGHQQLEWESDVAAAHHAARLIHRRAAHYWRGMLAFWIVTSLALWLTFDLWVELLPDSVLVAGRTSWLGLFTMLFLPYAALAFWALEVHRWSISMAFAEHKRHLPNPTVRALTAHLCNGLVRHQQRRNAALFLIGQFGAWGCRIFGLYSVLYVAVNFYWAYVAVRARME